MTTRKENRQRGYVPQYVSAETSPICSICSPSTIGVHTFRVR